MQRQQRCRGCGHQPRAHSAPQPHCNTTTLPPPQQPVAPKSPEIALNQGLATLHQSQPPAAITHPGRATAAPRGPVSPRLPSVAGTAMEGPAPPRGRALCRAATTAKTAGAQGSGSLPSPCWLRHRGRNVRSAMHHIPEHPWQEERAGGGMPPATLAPTLVSKPLSKTWGFLEHSGGINPPR